MKFNEKQPETTLAPTDGWPVDAMPVHVTYWISECRYILRRALTTREAQRGAILAGIDMRLKGQPLLPYHAEEITRRLARGDQVRELVDGWHERHRLGAIAAGKSWRSREDVACRPRYLSALCDLGLLPAPCFAIAEWLGERFTKRKKIDLDQRMAQANDSVESGDWG